MPLVLGEGLIVAALGAPLGGKHLEHPVQVLDPLPLRRGRLLLQVDSLRHKGVVPPALPPGAVGPLHLARSYVQPPGLPVPPLLLVLRPVLLALPTPSRPPCPHPVRPVVVGQARHRRRCRRGVVRPGPRPPRGHTLPARRRGATPGVPVVDGQPPLPELRAVHVLQGLGLGLGVLELHKAVALMPALLPVHGDSHLLHPAAALAEELGQALPHLLLRHAVVQALDVDGAIVATRAVPAGLGRARVPLVAAARSRSAAARLAVPAVAATAQDPRGKGPPERVLAPAAGRHGNEAPPPLPALLVRSAATGGLLALVLAPVQVPPAGSLLLLLALALRVGLGLRLGRLALIVVASRRAQTPPLRERVVMVMELGVQEREVSR